MTSLAYHNVLVLTFAFTVRYVLPMSVKAEESANRLMLT